MAHSAKFKMKRYVVEPTIRQFHASECFVRGIRGPIGSGKSVACCMEMYSRCLEQVAFEGIRRSRWCIIRNTYPELRDTTLNTFLDWIPEKIPGQGGICTLNRQAPMRAWISEPLPDGTRVEAEFIFLALDKEDDVKKLKSLELTGVWLNEASEIPKAVFDMARGRVRRYPSKNMGGYNWSGVIMDTNPPDDESWWYQLAEVEKPKNYLFLTQPPAIVPLKKKHKDSVQEYGPNDGQAGYLAAENVTNQNAGFAYWLDLVPGSTPEWIKVFLMGMYGTLTDGRPVYPEYVDDLHCSREILEPYRGLPLILGWDFGLTPCVVFMQLSPRGQLRVIDELVSENMGIRQFARNAVKPFLRNYYSGFDVISIGDPAGNQKGQSNEVTCLDELMAVGIPTEMGRTNNFIPRREAVAGFLNRMVDGQPGFLLSPKCKIVRKGFIGGYRYRRMRLSTGEAYASEPEKNPWSHPHDGLQYGAMYAESGSVALSRSNNAAPAGSSRRRSVSRHKSTC